MTKKTKAQKIAASLRIKHHGVLSPQPQSVSNQSEAEMQTVASPASSRRNHEVGVYEPKDLYKTFNTTLLILALITLVYTLQYKGYF